MCSSIDELAAKQHSGNSLRVRDIAERVRVQDQEVSRFARVAGPRGLDAPDALLRRIDSPVAPELLRLS